MGEKRVLIARKSHEKRGIDPEGGERTFPKGTGNQTNTEGWGAEWKKKDEVKKGWGAGVTVGDGLEGNKVRLIGSERKDNV